MWKEVNIAKLAYVDKKYWYKIIEENLEKSCNMGCPIILFKNQNCKQVLDKLPSIFEDFLFNKNRKDLLEKCKIDKNDTDFEKLCKISQQLNTNKNEFWIKVKQ